MPQVLNLRRKIKPKIELKTSLSKPQKNILKKEAVFSVQKQATEKPTAKLAVQPAATQPPQIVWRAPSFYFTPHKRYLAMTIIALALGGGTMLFLSKDALTAIFLLLSSLVLILYSTKRLEISEITIDQRGIAIGDTMYFYKDLRSFWIHYNPGEFKELSLEVKKWYLPYVKVSTENNDPLLIRSFLINFLPEREHEHSLVEIIARKIGL